MKSVKFKVIAKYCHKTLPIKTIDIWCISDCNFFLYCESKLNMDYHYALEMYPWVDVGASHLAYGSQSCKKEGRRRRRAKPLGPTPDSSLSNKMFIFLMLPMSDIRPSDSCIEAKWTDGREKMCQSKSHDEALFFILPQSWWSCFLVWVLGPIYYPLSSWKNDFCDLCHPIANRWVNIKTWFLILWNLYLMRGLFWF